MLVRRFEGTRRRHPLGQEGVTEAITLERERLEPIRAVADLIVDTTDLNVNQLRERLIDLFTTDRAEPMQISVMSFGFKHGVPLDVDNVFDVRFLPNPHWVDELRPLTGLDAPGAGFRAPPAGRRRVPGQGRRPARLLAAGVRQGGKGLT